MRRIFSSFAAFALAGCTMNPAPVPVRGDAWSIAALAGEWIGEYRSPDTRRSGSIHFSLDAGRDTAFGDVVMVPGLSSRQYTDDPEMWPRRFPLRSDPRALFIRFVRVEGNHVNGAINPYPSPDCDCMLHTSFAGIRRGDRIDGTFLTRHEDCGMKTESGTWWAERRRIAQ
jgi:hypothetical protein